MKLLYICGPIRNDDADIQTANIIRGIEAAKAIWQGGGAAICPHALAYFQEDNPASEQTQYIDGDLEMIKRCDAVLALRGWPSSVGASAEVCFARGQDIEILESLDDAVRWVQS